MCPAVCPAVMTEPSIPERHFARIAGVPRATRQDWAARGLTSPQNAPYAWAILAEVSGLRELRAHFELADIEVVWPQVRARVARWKEPESAELLVDLVTLQAAWSPDPDRLLAKVRRGDPVQLIDLAAALGRARDGFATAAPASGPRRKISDELARKRQRRKTKQTGS